MSVNNNSNQYYAHQTTVTTTTTTTTHLDPEIAKEVPAEEFWNTSEKTETTVTGDDIAITTKPAEEETAADKAAPEKETKEVEKETKEAEKEAADDGKLSNEDLNTYKTSIQQIIDANPEDDKKCPQDVIDMWVAAGTVTPEQGEQIAASFTRYSDGDEEMINAQWRAEMVNDPYISREEVIAKLESQGALGEPIKSAKTNSESAQKADISDQEAQKLADELHDSMKGGWFFGLGTDEKQFDAIFNNKDLSDADLVKVMDAYNDKYGSFLKDVEGDFSGKAQKKIEERIAGALVNQAEKGDELAMEHLVKEFHNNTGGKWGTADEYVAYIFNNASDDLIAKMNENYPKSVEGGDMIKDVKGDFSWGTEDKYLQRIYDSMAD